MNTQVSNSSTESENDIRRGFAELFEKSEAEKIDDRAYLLSLIFLGEAEKAMDKKNWTRKRLAEAIGTSASYLTQLFRGDRLLNFKTIAKIEAALETEFVVKAESLEEKAVRHYARHTFEKKIPGSFFKAAKISDAIARYEDFNPEQLTASEMRAA